MMSEQPQKQVEAPSSAASPISIPTFFGPDSSTWRNLRPVLTPEMQPEERARLEAEARKAKEDINAVLLASLQMQHVAVLAGSGTSLGPVKGPSMGTLWDYCVNENPAIGDSERTLHSSAQAVIAETEYNPSQKDKENIEALLSHCEAYLQIKQSTIVADFITKSKQVILEKCAEFLDPADDDQLKAHRTFLHRLSRRRVRDSRLKLFTTNYDLCFEMAAGRQSLVVLDGFSFSQPRIFDPRFFLYDIVRRPTNGDDAPTPLEGVFHLYKLHGSVNWARTTDSEIRIADKPSPETACLVYPAKGKYQQSYVQPHLELVSQYFSMLREPNTCLIVSGFGFNDDHLSEPIIAAVRTNPHLRLIVVNRSAQRLTTDTAASKYWRLLMDLVKQGEDVWFINASFGDFSEMIPDLKSLTPAQRLTRDIKLITETI